MISINEELINSLAPNDGALSNAKSIYNGKKIIKPSISKDETVIFCECMGSGKDNYKTSVDFINQEKPVFRCNCPSRQFPCKHGLAILYAYSNKMKFEKTEIPEDILQKREKIEKLEERKQKKIEEPPKDKKINKNALTKKIESQLEGLEILQKIVTSILQSGLGTINEKTIKLIETKIIELGNYYLPGAQNELSDFFIMFKDGRKDETLYIKALDKLSSIYSISVKAKEYLNKKKNDPELIMDKTTTIEEYLGYSWTLNDLDLYGLSYENIELIQLSFYSYYDEARLEYVDYGWYLNSLTGTIQETRNFRPVKALKYIKEDDSVFGIVKAKKLYVYPGETNPRIRWDEMSLRESNKSDLDTIHKWANNNFTDVIKNVKNYIKNPLSNKNPVVLLKYKKLGIVDNELVLEDTEGKRIVVKENKSTILPPTIQYIKLLDKCYLNDNSLLAVFENNIETLELTIKPLTIIGDRIIRFLF